jgi:hypothetical protein
VLRRLVYQHAEDARRRWGELRASTSAVGGRSRPATTVSRSIGDDLLERIVKLRQVEEGFEVEHGDGQVFPV